MMNRALVHTVLGSGGRALVFVACLALGACSVVPITGPDEAQSSARAAAEDLQIEIMAFSDSYTAILTEAFDQAAIAMPEKRGKLHTVRLRHVQNAINIAASQNPIGGLLDMTVMVTLQRQVAEDHWLPTEFGEAGMPIIEALITLEQEIWLITDRSLDASQAESLRELVPQIRERYRDRVFVSSLRATDFVDDRRAAVTRLKGGGNLLSLFNLDPLAGLSPTASELARSRLLAERAFFWAKRSPLILNWQVQDVILNTLSNPDSKQIINAASEMAESSHRLSDAVDRLLLQIPAERSAAMEQLAELTASEREAALNQTFEGLATEREAILRTFELEEVRLRGLLKDLQHTIEAGTVLSATLNTTVESTDQLFSRLSEPSSREPQAEDRPFDVTDYQTAAESITTTVEELNRLVLSVNDLMTSPAWTEGPSQIAAATDRAQSTMELMIDRGYRRGLTLLGLFVVSSLIAALMYRLISSRFITPKGGV